MVVPPLPLKPCTTPISRDVSTKCENSKSIIVNANGRSKKNKKMMKRVLKKLLLRRKLPKKKNDKFESPSKNDKIITSHHDEDDEIQSTDSSTYEGQLLSGGSSCSASGGEGVCVSEEAVKESCVVDESFIVEVGDDRTSKELNVAACKKRSTSTAPDQLEVGNDSDEEGSHDHHDWDEGSSLSFNSWEDCFEELSEGGSIHDGDGEGADPMVSETQDKMMMTAILYLQHEKFPSSHFHLLEKIDEEISSCGGDSNASDDADSEIAPQDKISAVSDQQYSLNHDFSGDSDVVKKQIEIPGTPSGSKREKIPQPSSPKGLSPTGIDDNDKRLIFSPTSVLDTGEEDMITSTPNRRHSWKGPENRDSSLHSLQVAFRDLELKNDHMNQISPAKSFDDIELFLNRD